MSRPQPLLGSIRPRNGRWQLRYRVSGRETSETFDTDEEAFAEAQRLSAMGTTGRRSRALGRTLAIEDAALLWARHRRFEESTRQTNQSHLRNHILPTFGGRPLAQIAKLEVEDWLYLLPLAPKTIQRILGVLRSICQFGLDQGWLERDPTYRLRVDGANGSTIRFLPSIDQIEDLRVAIDSRYGAMVDVMAYGGCSISEAAGLRVGDLDFDRRLLHVHSIRKMVADGPAVISDVMKTPTRNRWVPVIPERVWDRLDKIDRTDPSALVAAAPRGGVLHPDNFRNRVFRPAVRQVFGDACELRPHGLRHFAVSLWLAAEMIKTDVGDWAGHNGTGMVDRIYGHALPRNASALEVSTLKEVAAGRSYPRLGSGVATEPMRMAA